MGICCDERQSLVPDCPFMNHDGLDELFFLFKKKLSCSCIVRLVASAREPLSERKKEEHNSAAPSSGTLYYTWVAQL